MLLNCNKAVIFQGCCFFFIISLVFHALSLDGYKRTFGDFQFMNAKKVITKAGYKHFV